MSHRMSHRKLLISVAMLWAGAAGLHAQATSQLSSQVTPTTQLTITVRGRVEVAGAEGKSKTRHAAIPGTVVWLTAMTGAGGEATAAALPRSPASLAAKSWLVQKNQRFA